MNLPEQLRFERTRLNLSRNDLSNLLEKAGLKNCSVNSIQRWESETQTTDIPVDVLAYLSDFYGISIDDLVNEDVEPKHSTEPNYQQLGKFIMDYFNVHNSTEFFEKYQIYKNSIWAIGPKYDLIFRTFHTYLADDKCPLQSIVYALRCLVYWYVDEKAEKHGIVNNIYFDSAGDTSVKDKRDPVNIVNLLSELELLHGDIHGLVENFYDTDVEDNLCEYLEP